MKTWRKSRTLWMDEESLSKTGKALNRMLSIEWEIRALKKWDEEKESVWVWASMWAWRMRGKHTERQRWWEEKEAGADIETDGDNEEESPGNRKRNVMLWYSKWNRINCFGGTKLLITVLVLREMKTEQTERQKSRKAPLKLPLRERKR